jgi:hypothetical protein
MQELFGIQTVLGKIKREVIDMTRMYFACANCKKPIEGIYVQTPITIEKQWNGLTLCKECGWGESEDGRPETIGHAHIEYMIFRGKAK